jgi:hypothetical protein
MRYSVGTLATRPRTDRIYRKERKMRHGKVKAPLGKFEEWIVGYSIWESGVYIVTLRPVDTSCTLDAPIGMTLSKKDAEIVTDWLNRGGLYELFMTATNVIEVEEIINPPPKGATSDD